MSAELELERLIIRLVGDGSDYAAMLQRALQQTKDFVAQARAAMAEAESAGGTKGLSPAKKRQEEISKQNAQAKMALNLQKQAMAEKQALEDAELKAAESRQTARERRERRNRDHMSKMRVAAAKERAEIEKISSEAAAFVGGRRGGTPPPFVGPPIELAYSRNVTVGGADLTAAQRRAINRRALDEQEAMRRAGVNKAIEGMRAREQAQVDRQNKALTLQKQYEKEAEASTKQFNKRGVEAALAGMKERGETEKNLWDMVRAHRKQMAEIDKAAAKGEVGPPRELMSSAAMVRERERVREAERRQAALEQAMEAQRRQEKLDQTRHNQALDRQKKLDAEMKRQGNERQRLLDQELKRRKDAQEQEVNNIRTSWLRSRRNSLRDERAAEKEKTRALRAEERERERAANERSARQVEYDAYQQRRRAEQIQRSQDTARGVAFVGGAAAGVSAAAIGVSVKAFSDYDTAMKRSQSIMEVSTRQRKLMEEQTFDLASTTKFSATEIANAYYALASAGMDTEAAIRAMPAAINFATAGNFDLEKSTKVATIALNALGLASPEPEENLQNLTKVMDVLTRAEMKAVGNAEAFAQALSRQGGAAAKLFGKDVEEVTAMLMAFSQQGAIGAIGGVQFSMMMRHITSNFIKHQEAFKKYGFEVFDRKTQELKKGADMIESLEKALAGMTPEAKFGAMLQMGFEARTIQGIMPLIGMSHKIREDTKDLRLNRMGMNAEVARKQMESFGNQMKVLYNQIEVVAIIVGRALSPAFIVLADLTKPLVAWFRTLDTQMIKNVATVTLITTLFVGAAAAIAGAWAILGPIFATVLLPVAAILATVTAAGVAVGVMIVRAGGIEQAWAKVKAAALAAWEWLEPVRMALADLWGTLAVTAERAWTSVSTLVKNVWAAIFGQTDMVKVRDAVTEFIQFIDFSLRNMGQAADVGWAYMKYAAVAALNYISANIFTILSGKSLIAALTWMLSKWGEYLEKLFSANQKTWQRLADLAFDYFKILAALMQGNLVSALDTYKKMTAKFQLGDIEVTGEGFKFKVLDDMEAQLKKEWEQKAKALGKSFEDFKAEREAEKAWKKFLDVPEKEAEKSKKEVEKTAEEMTKRWDQGVRAGSIKFDAALRFSAEAMSRIQQFRDDVLGTGRGGGGAGAAGGRNKVPGQVRVKEPMERRKEVADAEQQNENMKKVLPLLSKMLENDEEWLKQPRFDLKQAGLEGV